MSALSTVRDTDRDWEAVAKANPYFGVLTNPRYMGRKLPDRISKEFFETGEIDIAHTLTLFERHFRRPERFRHAVDFGCGVGRLLKAMLPHADTVSGVDVSKAMLKKAKRYAPGADLYRDIPDGPFDWVNSLIVFQHILPDRGLALFDQLLERAAPDCLLSVHFTINVLPRVDGGEVGRISMYSYDLPAILARFAQHGFPTVVTEYLDHGGDKGVRCVAGRGAYAA